MWRMMVFWQSAKLFLYSEKQGGSAEDVYLFGGSLAAAREFRDYPTK